MIANDMVVVAYFDVASTYLTRVCNNIIVKPFYHFHLRIILFGVSEYIILYIIVTVCIRTAYSLVLVLYKWPVKFGCKLTLHLLGYKCDGGTDD